jgi:hypothetical protein
MRQSHVTCIHHDPFALKGFFLVLRFRIRGTWLAYLSLAFLCFEKTRRRLCILTANYPDLPYLLLAARTDVQTSYLWQRGAQEIMKRSRGIDGHLILLVHCRIYWCIGG